MTESQLKSLLEANALGCYYDILIKEKLCNSDIWDNITEEDLSTIGVNSLGDRKLLLKIMREPNRTTAANSQASDTVLAENSSDRASKRHKSIIIALSVLAIGILAFWIAGGSYYVKEATATFERGAYNKGAEKAYSAAVSFFKSLDSTPFDAKFDSFSEAIIREIKPNAFEIKMKYTYQKNGQSFDRACSAVLSLDSKNNWCVGYHYPDE